MAEPTLVQIFGANATQDATTLTISKADLTTFGLTPSANNTAESIFVALLLQAAAQLTEENLELNVEQQITVIQSDIQSLVTRGELQYRQVTFDIALQTPDITFTLDPNNF